MALGVLAGRLRLRRVPLEGAAELKALVLCWHGDAEPWEALGVQVGLHTCRHAVGALETSPPATKRVSAIHPIYTEHCIVVISIDCVVITTLNMPAYDTQTCENVMSVDLLINGLTSLNPAYPHPTLPCDEVQGLTQISALLSSFHPPCHIWWLQKVGDHINRCVIAYMYCVKLQVFSSYACASDP